MATEPELNGVVGMMPILVIPGRRMPGVLGPMILVGEWLIFPSTAISSCWGIPSVMQAVKEIRFSAASSMASGAWAGGTKMMLAPMSCLRPAWATESYTGTPSTVGPSLKGVTPAMMFAP